MKKLSLIFLMVFQAAVLLLPACGQKGPLPSPDKIPPHVSSISPGSGAQDVAVNSSIMVVFSEAMDTSTINEQSITIFDGSGNVQGSCMYTDTTAVFKPSSELNGKSVYTVTVDAGVKDSSGNAMGMPFTSTFITGTTPDRTPPTVSATAPADGAIGAGVGSINVTFSEPVDPQTISFILNAGSTNVPCTMTYNGTAADFTPESGALSYNTSYTARVSAGVKDMADNPMANDHVWNFTTEAKPDITPPRVIDIQPSNRTQNASPSTTISTMFSEPMDSATISTATIKVVTVSGNIPGRVTYNRTIGAATFTPDNVFSSNTTYIVTVSTGVTDVAKNVMTNAFVSNFKTGSANDSTPPNVLTSDNGPTGSSVSVNAPIIVPFSEAINASTITPANIIISEGSITVPGAINYYETTAVFTPNAPLKFATLYTVTISKAISDIAGNAMSADYTWTFTTEPQAPDTVNPHVVSTLPDSTQNNVPVYKQIVAICSENMTERTTGSPAFILADQNGSVPGEVAFRGSAILFTPKQPLAYNTVYTATITSGATDVAGNPLVGNSSAGYAWSFTTEAIASFSITATAGQNGSINPAGSIAVNYGGSKALTITPNAHYHIADVVVDGSTIGPVSSYQFTNVIADHTISVSFAIDTLTVTPSAGANGSISPSAAQTVNYNGTTSFTLSPSAGYHVVSPVGGTCGGNLSGNTYTTNAVTANCTVIVSFAINTYTVTPSVSGGNGTITPATAQIVSYGSTTSFTLNPTVGYHAVMAGTCGGTLSGNIYTTNAVAANCTVVASFVINTNTITTAVVTNGTGTISPVNPSVNYNTNQSFTITPTTGYHIADVQVDGVSQGSVTSFTFNNVTAGHTISASFAIDTFTITPSVGANGGISPSAAQIVSYGSTTTFTFTPDPGYYVSVVTVDGAPVPGLPNSYTFSNVTANHTIAVSFALGTYNIMASAGQGGTISPEGTLLVSYNGNRMFTITPNTGYHTVDVLVDNVSIGAQTTYTFTNVKDNHTITASFAINTYTVTPSVSGGNGSISPATAQTVNYNAQTSFTLTPTTVGYHLVTPVGGTCGGTLAGDGSTYTTNPITSNCTVIANFAIDTFAINFASGGNGTLSGTTSQTVNYGGSTTAVTAVPSIGYHLVNWTGTGGFVTTTANPLTVTNVTTAQNITANFAIDTFAINFASGGNGTLSGTTSQTVNYGGSTTAVTASPSPGYHLVNWTGTGGFVTTTTNPLTVTNVTTAQNITANFAIDTFAINFASGGNGTLSGTTSQTVNYGGSTTAVTASPSIGYHLVNWTGTGGFVTTTANPLTVTNVTAAQNITANFAIDTFAINFASGGNGTLSGTTSQTVNYGGSTSAVTASPSIGYHLVNWTGTGGFVTTTANPLTVTNVTAAQTITANFAIDTFAINFVVGSNGSLTGNTNQTVIYGGSATSVTAAPTTAGYHFVNWTGTGGFVTTTANPLTVTNVTAAQNITANFAIDTFAINFAPGGNGTLSGTTSQTVNYGGSTTAVTAVPLIGYHLVNWTGTGGFVTTTANPLTVTNVTTAQNITANFAIDTFAINFAPGGNGTLSGTTSQTVNYGGSTTAVTASPSPGYHLVNWTGTGGFVTTTTNPLTVTNVTTAQNITANFATDTFAINFASGGNGTLSGTTSQTVNYGGSTTAVTAVPSIGYHLVNWTGTGGFVTTTANPLTVTNVTAAQNITANFATDTFAINFASGGNGTLSGTTSQTVNYGGSTTAVTAVPSIGYHLVNWTGTGGFVTTTANPLTVTNVTTAKNITANFAIDAFTITASAGSNGGISPSGAVSVNYGANQSFTITPNAGYAISNMTVDGAIVAFVNPYTFTNVTANHTITVSFANITHVITASAGAGGAIDPSGTWLVNDGSSKVFTLTADPGNILVTPVGGTCGGTLAGDGITYTTAAVSDDCSVQANFLPI